MRRLGRIRLALVVMLAVLSLGIVPAASADSGWRCGYIGLDGNQVCLRVVGSGHYMRGADIKVTATRSGCTTGRFYHYVADSGGNIIGDIVWHDDGAFQVCYGYPRTYYWTHAGSGAYVPTGGYVLGYFANWASGRYDYSNRVRYGEF